MRQSVSVSLTSFILALLTELALLFLLNEFVIMPQLGEYSRGFGVAASFTPQIDVIYVEGCVRLRLVPY